MKKLFLFILLDIILHFTCFSQDKIITVQHDTIDCKITRVTRNMICFDLVTAGVKTSGRIPAGSVVTYIVSGKGSTVDMSLPDEKRFSRLNVGINSGFGYLTGSSKKAEEAMTGSVTGFSAGNAKAYYRRLKSGFYGDADVAWMIKPNFGTGIRYKFFDTNSSTEGYFDPQDGVHMMYGNYSEQIYVNYFGAQFLYSQYAGRKKSLLLTSSYSLGLAAYRNEAEYIMGRYLLTGKGLGMDSKISLEYFVSPRFSLGTGLSFFYSTLRKVKITDGTNTSTSNLDKENYENLSRVELSFGIRFYLPEK